MNHFSVNLMPSHFRDYNEHSSLPAHDLILRPLLLFATDCYVYGIQKNSELLQQCSHILISTRNKYKVDLNQEAIKGYEQLWNVTGWGRGSIVIVMGLEQFENLDILSYCYDPDILDNPNTGESIAAVRYSKDMAKQGKVALCLSASNGIEWMNIYASDDVLEKLYVRATKECLDSYSDTIYKPQKSKGNCLNNTFRYRKLC
ncbi:hypothetical protein, partial [Bacillus toyonensis]